MKRSIIILIVLMIGVSSLFATRIGITYKGVDYILNTTRSITNENKAYFTGMNDAFVCLKEYRQLYEIQTVIEQKVFLDANGKMDVEQKAEYVEAFIDCMTNYSYGSMGDFEDIYPLYDSLMKSPITYATAQEIVEFGRSRFYIKNV